MHKEFYVHLFNQTETNYFIQVGSKVEFMLVSGRGSKRLLPTNSLNCTMQLFSSTYLL